MSLFGFLNPASSIVSETKNAETKNSESKNTETKARAAPPLSPELLGPVRAGLRKSLSQVSSSLDTAVTAGGAAGGSVKRILSQTNEMHGKLSGASSAVDEISATITSFNGLIDKQNSVLALTEGAVDKMSGAVKTVSEVTSFRVETAGTLQSIIEKGGNDVTSTARAIEEVTIGITAVADVIKVINSIAAQTNLLAMNAAIEAAHAGDAGRGFAVVASEVRKLAESTTANSKAISESLKSIISQIQAARAESESAGTTFGNIRKEVETFVAAFREIAASMSDLSGSNQQIFSSMADLKQVSSEISNGSREIAAGTEQINVSLRGIRDFSTGLIRDVEGIKENVFDISAAQSGIAQYMVETNRTTEGFFNVMQEQKVMAKEKELFNYDFIVLMHRNWLIQLRAFLDERKQGLKAASSDHENCDLGQWIYGDGKRLSGGVTYRELEDKHKKFHAAAGAIIKEKTSGNREKAEELYTKLMDDYRDMLSLLDKLRKERG